MNVVGMLATGAVALGAVVAAVVGVMSIPDIRRYVRMRRPPPSSGLGPPLPGCVGRGGGGTGLGADSTASGITMPLPAIRHE